MFAIEEKYKKIIMDHAVLISTYQKCRGGDGLGVGLAVQVAI